MNKHHIIIQLFKTTGSVHSTISEMDRKVLLIVILCLEIAE